MPNHLSRRALLGGGAALVATGALAAPRRRTKTPAHFVLVHGSFHGAWCWYRVTAALEAAGHRVSALDLPSGGIDPTPPLDVSLETQTDAVVAFLDTLDAPVVLVGHSAGGPVISNVAERRPQAIAKLVYVSAYLLPDGASIVSTMPGDAGSLVPPNLVAGPDGLTVRRDAVREVFYGLSPDADVALALSLLKPIGPYTTLQPVRVGAAFASVRRFYVACSRDRAVTPAFQRALYEAMPCERVFTLRADHSPFFSRPEALGRVLQTIARA
jgi:pimeloyl-ACP methyl ester carboxylesterase